MLRREYFMSCFSLDGGLIASSAAFETSIDVTKLVGNQQCLAETSPCFLFRL